MTLYNITLKFSRIDSFSDTSEFVLDLIANKHFKLDYFGTLSTNDVCHSEKEMQNTTLMSIIFDMKSQDFVLDETLTVHELGQVIKAIITSYDKIGVKNTGNDIAVYCR